MQKCHLVYAVPNTGSKVRRLCRKSLDLLQRTALPISAIGNRQNVRTGSWPESYPSVVTARLYSELSVRMPTLLYDLREQVRAKFETGDIFLGHPRFPYSSGVKGVTELSVGQEPRPQVVALISPLHCNIEVNTKHINKAYLDAIEQLLPKADMLFAIMGPYWWDQWDSSPYAHWKPKMIRLDLAVEVRRFPRVKKRFNAPGKRGYLYIGRNDPMKGIEFLSTLLTEVGEYPRGWIGPGPEIPGVPRISTPRLLTPKLMNHVAERFDFFITTGLADPNPTTVLESMAWGFPVICTPQSGYYATSYRCNVYHEDLSSSVQTLRELQFCDETKLIEMADEARRVVEADHNWQKFVSKVLTIVERK